MTNEFETMQTAPTLTLEPFAEEVAAPVIEEVQQEILDEQILTEEEKAQADINIPMLIDLTPQEAQKKAIDAGFSINIYRHSRNTYSKKQVRYVYAKMCTSSIRGRGRNISYY